MPVQNEQSFDFIRLGCGIQLAKNLKLTKQKIIISFPVGHVHSHALKVENRLACGANEVLYECAIDRECERTCTNLNENLQCMPSCEERCICNDGYVRNNAGQCILIASC